MTWTFILPTSGADPASIRLSDLATTIWFGATLRDTKSLFGQAIAELQFYPDGVVSHCKSDGEFFQVEQINTWGACIPVWAVTPPNSDNPGVEYAAYDQSVNLSSSATPLTFHSGDTVTVHYFKGAQKGTPMNVDVTDVTSGARAGTIALVSKTDGPLQPIVGANTKSNALKWGNTQSSPLNVAWEIGHASRFRYPDADICYPGGFNCWGYNVTNGWQQATPLKITSAVFGGGVKPSSWTVNDGQGGITEDIATCGFFDAPRSNGFCTYPYWSYDGATERVSKFGGTYADTTAIYGGAHQFALALKCAEFTLYCATTLSPTPPVP